MYVRASFGSCWTPLQSLHSSLWLNVALKLDRIYHYNFHRALLSQVEKACRREYVKEPSDENLTCKANPGAPKSLNKMLMLSLEVRI